MKTYMAKGETVERKWYVVDATDMVLGRLSSQVAAILRGKNKPIFTPHVDTGDCVIIVNAAKVRLTGNKLADKTHIHHTGYPGGIKEITYGELLVRVHPPDDAQGTPGPQDAQEAAHLRRTHPQPRGPAARSACAQIRRRNDYGKNRFHRHRAS